jgi:hypothetical protein
MFDLDQAITTWRQQMLAAGIETSDVLNELENHLREEMNALRSSGMSQDQAFVMATVRLGNPVSVQSEFNKIRPDRRLPMLIAFFALLVTGILLSATSLLAIVLTGRMSFLLFSRSLLLFSHILTLTAGYAAAFMAGSVGVGYVCRRWTQRFTKSPRSSLIWTVTLFTRISAILIVVGYLLGMLWSKQDRGTFFTGTAREIAPIFVLAWTLIELFVQRFFRANTQIIILLAIAGNIVVSLAWFGRLIVVSQSYEFANHIPLASFIAIHCIFLAIGSLPERSMETAS